MTSIQRPTIVIPAFNEEARIGAVIAAVLPHAGEVIVVDDGSQDGTAAAAQRAGARVIRNRSNLGYVAAIKHGFAAASGDVVVTIDGDGELPPAAIPDLVAPITAGIADMVQGNRPRAPRRSEAFLTRMAGLAATVGDSGTGLRAIRTELARELVIEGRCICGTLTLEAVSRGARIAEIPVTPSSVSKPRRIAWGHGPQLLYVLRWMWRVRRRRRAQRR